MSYEKETKEIMKENIVNFLPEWQHIFIEHPIFIQLSQSVMEYLSAKGEDRIPKLRAMEHARDNFNHFTMNDEEGKLEKIRIDKKYEIIYKDLKLKSLMMKGDS